MANKKNDWLATLLFQPNMDFQDFANNDITPDNTSIQSRDYYKNIQDVTDAFTDESGKFNDNHFENFYQSALSMYNVYAASDFENKIMETFDYDMFDYFAPAGAKIRDNNPRLVNIVNPERRSAGLTNIRGVGEATMSAREIGQQNKVFNWDTQKFEDWTPEDRGGLFKALARPTLVLASWDEDGEHVFQGRRVFHKAGDLKFNESGETYYETLGNRDMYGKQVLAYGDTLTREGSWLNKYDFFDSDGLDKSVTGTVAKLVFSVGPMLIPGVGNIYGVISAGVALSQLVPTLMKSINGIIGLDSDSEFVNQLNRTEAYFARFNSSASDYSQQNLISLENLGQLVQDVSLQLFQQRLIGQIPGYLSNAPQSVRTRNLGQRLALAYMAGTSSQQVYSEFKEAGADDRIAGLGMIASIAAMYKLMTLDYFRDMLFKGTYLDESPVKDAIKGAAKEYQSAFRYGAVKTPQGAAKFVNNVSNFIQKNVLSSKNPYLNRAINEGIEEVFEEVSQDTVKALFAGANALGIPVNESNTPLDFDFTPQEFAERYAMSFFGGAIGGPIFELHGSWQNRLKGISNRVAQTGPNANMQELVYLLREGRGDEMRDLLEHWRTKGKLGNKNLAGLTYEIVNDGDNPIKFHPAEQGQSQNDIIYEQLIDYIDRVESLMSFEGLKISDHVLQKFELGIQDGQPLDLVAEAIIDSGVHSRVYQDVNNLATRIAQTSAKLNNLTAPVSTESADPKSTEARAAIEANSAEVQKLQTILDGYREEFRQIISGEKTDYYFGQSLFALDENVHNGFLSITQTDYSQIVYGKDFNSLTSDQQNEVAQNWKEFIELDGKERTFRAYDLYVSLNDKLAPTLQKAVENINIEQNALYSFGKINFSSIQNFERAAKQIEKQISDALENEEVNEEEVQELRNQLDNVNQLKSFYESNTELVTTAQLTPEGEMLMNRQFTLSNQNEFDAYAKGILDFYNYAATMGIAVDLGDGDLNVLLNNVKAFNEQSLWTAYKEVVDRMIDDETLLDLDVSHDPLVNETFDGSLQNRLESLFNDFESNLGQNNELALSIWNEIEQIFKDSDLTPELSEQILGEIQPGLDGQNLVDYVKEYYNIKSNAITSPAYELLDQFNIITNGNVGSLLDLLKAEQFRFANSKALEDYIIQNKTVQEQFKELQSIIGALKSIVNGATTIEDNGFNHNVNLKKANIGNENVLPEIDINTNYLLTSDLNRIESRVNYLLELSRQNDNQKLRTNRDIAINIKQKFLQYLVSDNSLIKTQFNILFGVDLDATWNKYNFIGDVTPENFNEFELALVNFESDLFTQIYNKFSNDELADNLVSLFNKSELYKQVSTKLQKDTDYITDYDALIYLATILTYPSNNFYSDLKEIISNPEYQHAPIYSQEYSVRIGHAMLQNKELFNKIIDQLPDPTSTSYIKEKSKLYNFHLTFGGAGTGKTTGIGYLLNQLISNSSTITLAPTTKQVDKLNVAIGNQNGKAFNKSDFIEQILGRQLTNDDFMNYNVDVGEVGHLHLKSNIHPLTTDQLFDNNKTKLLFIDEVSYFNEAELKLISKWAQVNDVMIFAFGDQKQNAIQTIVNGITVDGGIEDTYHIKSPNLTSTLRPNNIGKNDNYNVLNAFLEDVMYNYAQNPESTLSDLNEYLKSKLDGNNVALKYFETNDQFVGEKIVNSDQDIISMIPTLTKLSDEVAILTDNPTKYQSTRGVTVMNIADVQGSEFDYVLIDKNWDVNPFLALRDVYTMTQRSRLGTVLLKNNFDQSIPAINSVFDPTINNNIQLNEQDIENFKNERLQSLEQITPNEEYKNLDYDVTTLDVTENNEIDTVDEIRETQRSFEEVNDTPVPVTNINVNPNESPYTQERISSEVQSDVDTNNSLESEVGEEQVIENIPKPNVQTEGIVEQMVDPIVRNKPITKSIPKRKVYTNTKTTEFAQNTQFFDWMANQMWDEERDNPNSLVNVFKLGNGKINKNQYRDILKTLSGYYKFGHYKNPIKHQRNILNLLNGIFPNNSSVINPIVSNLQNYEFNIIPYGIGQGMLVSSMQINGQTMNIPLFITSANYGRYNGEIELIEGPKIVRGEEGVLNYIGSLNPDGMFNIHSEYIIPVVDPRKHDISDQSLKKFLFDDKNNGKAFALFTDDPMVNTTAFTANLAPTIASDGEITYLIQEDQRFTLMGVQNNIPFSDVVQRSKNQVQRLRGELENVPGDDRNGKFETFKKYDSNDSQILYKDRTGEFLTEVINLSRQSVDLQSSLFSAMFEYLTTSLKDDLSINFPAMSFDLKLYDDQTGKIKIKSYLLRQQTVTSDNGKKVSRLRLYNFKNKTIEGDYLIEVPIDYNNLYNIIEWIGQDNNLQFNGIIDSTILSTSLTSINRDGKVFPLSSNRTVELITRKLANPELLDDVFSQTEKFKNGLYIQDHKRQTPVGTYVFPLADSKKGYRTDVSELIGSVFAIDKTQIIKQTSKPDPIQPKIDEFNLKIDTLKTQLKENGLLYTFELDQINLTELAKENSLDELYDYTIQQMNQDLREKTRDITYKQYNGTDFITVRGYIQLIENLLHEYGEVPIDIDKNSIEIISDDILNFVPFYVTLGDEKVGYNIQNNNGKWELFRFNSVNSYTELLNFYNNNEDKIGQFLTRGLENYILNLFGNTEITSEQSIDYYSDIQVLSSNPLVNELNTLVNNYLLERLQNNEC